MANECKIRNKSKISPKVVLDHVVSEFKTKYGLDVSYSLEKGYGELKLKELIVPLWIKPTYFETFDVDSTSYFRGSHSETKHMEMIQKLIEKYFIFSYSCGFLYSFFFRTSVNLIAKKLNAKIDSDGIGPYDPSESDLYTLKFDSFESWAKSATDKEIAHYKKSLIKKLLPTKGFTKILEADLKYLKET